VQPASGKAGRAGWIAAGARAELFVTKPRRVATTETGRWGRWALAKVFRPVNRTLGRMISSRALPMWGAVL